jgi:microcystin-dependent protein
LNNKKIYMKYLQYASLFIFFLLADINLFAQAPPSGFSFQTVVRGSDGRLMKNKSVTLVFALRPDQGATAVWQETRTLITDSYGVATTVVGEGTTNQVTGPTQFRNIQFGQGGYWLKVSLNSASGPVISDQKFNSVPYARYAEYSNNTFPPGLIIPFGGDVNRIPKGWMLCDGRPLNANDTAGGDGTALSRLYNTIGTNWGGTGPSAFRLPDLRGQFLRGADLGALVDPDVNTRVKKYTAESGNSGGNVGSYQADTLGAHRHNLASFYRITETNNGDDDSDGWNEFRGSTWVNPPTTITGGNETRPVNAYVLYIIKL